MMSSGSVRSMAGKFHETSSGLRAPTNSEVTPFCCLTQAKATAAIGWPISSEMVCISLSASKTSVSHPGSSCLAISRLLL